MQLLQIDFFCLVLRSTWGRIIGAMRETVWGVAMLGNWIYMELMLSRQSREE